MALRLRDDTDRLYMPRKEEGRRLASIEDSVDASICGFEDDIKKSKESLISETRNNIDNIKINRTAIVRKPGREEKQLNGYFNLQTDDISYEKT